MKLEHIIRLLVASWIGLVEANAGDLLVPSQYPTIQDALDAATNGDQILVDDGTFGEALIFPAKNVHLRSRNGPELCVIDAGGTGPVVHFVAGATNQSIIEGFTITGGEFVFGGGIYCEIGAQPSILRNWIIGNHGSIDGGGVFPRPENTLVIDGNLIGWNVADGQAGGLQAPSSASVVRNNVFVGNQANYGGAYFIRIESSVNLVNCSFYGNSAPNGSVASGDGGLTLTNCVVWGHTGSMFHLFGPGSLSVLFSDVEGGTGQPWHGAGCIDSDPLFTDALGGDLRLMAGSPCIDAGDGTASIGSLDLDGQPRVAGAAVDMGAFEYVPTRPSIVVEGQPELGGSLTVRYHVHPNDAIFAIVGVPPEVSVSSSPFEGKLCILPFQLLFLVNSWPTDELVLQGTIPDVPALAGVEILLQALAGPMLTGSGRSGEWTPCTSIEIQSP
jgi:hypothetical protein